MKTATASTPCTRVCALDRDGVCLGCHRTVDEIVRWRDMDESERQRLMRDVLPLRAKSNHAGA
jgi:predicted Fe-S protein YdhL (DUF1289 family)